MTQIFTDDFIKVKALASLWRRVVFLHGFHGLHRFFETRSRASSQFQNYASGRNALRRNQWRSDRSVASPLKAPENEIKNGEVRSFASIKKSSKKYENRNTNVSLCA